MALSKRQVSQLQKIVETVQAILAAEVKPGSQPSKQTTASRDSASKSSSRRTGKELAAFRKALRAERKSGVPVAEIAKRHKVSRSYIYQL
jgi:DNA invertase Pin-like site-specific DNA recombinase